MEIYDAIFYRKSIRKYSNKKLTSELIQQVEDICSDISYLNNELAIKAHLIERGHLVHLSMGKECTVKAPHYIILTSTKGDDDLQNVGFAAEEVVLKLTTLGIGTCYVEDQVSLDDFTEFLKVKEDEIIVKEAIKIQENDENSIDNDDKDENENEERPYITIALGYPNEDEALFRTYGQNVDRKSVKHICKKSDERLKEVLEIARLSPSIKNCQPWVIYNDKDCTNIYMEKQKKNIDNLSKISMGIFLRHFDIACKKYKINVEYKKIKSKKRMNKQYYISAILN